MGGEGGAERLAWFAPPQPGSQCRAKGRGIRTTLAPEVLRGASRTTTPTTPPPGGADFLGAARRLTCGLGAGGVRDGVHLQPVLGRVQGAGLTGSQDRSHGQRLRMVTRGGRHRFVHKTALWFFSFSWNWLQWPHFITDIRDSVYSPFFFFLSLSRCFLLEEPDFYCFDLSVLLSDLWFH